MKIYINDFEFISALGSDKDLILKHLIKSNKTKDPNYHLLDGSLTPTFEVQESLPEMPSQYKKFETRNNRLVLFLLSKLQESLKNSFDKYSKARVAVVLGTSCLLYTSPSPRDGLLSRMPSSA